MGHQVIADMTGHFTKQRSVSYWPVPNSLTIIILMLSKRADHDRFLIRTKVDFPNLLVINVIFYQPVFELVF